MSRFGKFSFVLASLLALTAALSTASLAAPPPGQGRAASRPTGTLYIESNDPSGNSIIAYHYDATGQLNLIPNGVFATGGAGLSQLDSLLGPPSAVLDADQQVIANPERTLLFAVNQGANSVSVFHILSSGRLSPVSGSPFPSGGTSPVSLGLAGNVLVVVNNNADPSLWSPFEAGSAFSPAGLPSYNTFIVGADGSLTPAASFPFGPFFAAPSQALISPDGSLFFDAQFFAGNVVAFAINADGSLAPGPNSPFALDPSVVFPPNIIPVAPLAAPLGVAAHRTLPLIYVNLAPVVALMVFSYDEAGTLTFVNSVPNEGDDPNSGNDVFAACWIAITPDQRYLYVSNTNTNNVSAYDIGSDPTTPRQLQVVQLKSEAGPRVGNPIEMAVDPTGRFLFVLTAQRVDDVPAETANGVHTLRINDDGTLTEIGASPAAIPVPPGVQPQGIVVIN